jgi:REP element-mobilizing transposase RayT
MVQKRCNSIKDKALRQCQIWTMELDPNHIYA